MREEENNVPNNALIWLGLAQGSALYALYKTHEAMLWPIEWGPLLNALLLSFLLLPLVVYWSQGILTRHTLIKLIAGDGLSHHGHQCLSSLDTVLIYGLIYGP